MIVEQIEEQIGNVLNKAKDLKIKISEMPEQACGLAKKSELTARRSLHKVFNDGLTLLGKGLINGRKAKEAFVAETNRKAKRFQDNAEAEVIEEGPVSTVKKVLKKKTARKTTSTARLH